MGLIKTLTSSVSSSFGDQFKEYVTCPEVDKDVLIVRGVVHHGDGNKNPSEGVISNGSVIVIPQNWAMMLVDNGKVEFSAEPGEFTYDSGSEPSIFCEGLWKGIIDTFKTIGNRFTFGGQTAKDQRVYYINMREVPGIKFGSSSPKDIYDETYQMSIKMTFYGTFNYKVEDPLALVNTVLGANPSDKVTFNDVFGESFRSEVNEQMHKALTLLMAEKKCRFSQIGAYGSDLSDELNKIMSDKWSKYGVSVVDVSMENIGTTEEYTEKIREIESKNTEARMLGKTYSENLTGTMA
ncbi:MAG: SPFH domain-containing protein, partial [Clostridia bacterium]|nr:SPFH domain-containing protein [Clostridia bacterium]